MSMSTTGAFRSASMALMLLIGGPLACGHTQGVGDTSAKPSSDNAKPPTDERGSGAGSAKKRGTSTGGKTIGAGPLKGDWREGAPPLATSPAGLLKPHAVHAIQEKLVAKGRLSADRQTGVLDEPTRDALRDFQRESNLPATGMPDDVTAQKLGLGPGNIFRASEAPRREGDQPDAGGR